MQPKFSISVLYSLLFGLQLYPKCEPLEVLMGFLLARHETKMLGGRTRLTHQKLAHNFEGVAVAGAMTLARDKVNYENRQSNYSIIRNLTLDFIWGNTEGDTLLGIKRLTNMWKRGTVAYIGPSITCDVEARIAAAWNMPMISYGCTNHEVSDKSLYPTFARTGPPPIQVTKSILSLLLNYNWQKFSMVVAKDTKWESIAENVEHLAEEYGLKINGKFYYNEPFIMDGELNQPFPGIVESSYRNTRVYVYLGNYDGLLGFMMALQKHGLLITGNYMVIHVDLQAYKSEMYQSGLSRAKYFRSTAIPVHGSLVDAARSLFVIVHSPPSNPYYANFTALVNRNRKVPPFNFRAPIPIQPKLKMAYVYDAVLLYADALRSVLLEGGSVTDGRAIINKVLGRSYKSIQGFLTQIDKNGDSEGNFTVLARQEFVSAYVNYSMLPVGQFKLDDEYYNDTLPTFELKKGVTIDWVGGEPPVDEPRCGYRGEKCISHPNYALEIALGIVGSLLLIVALVGLVLYRNWRYEQEIAGLLWRINLLELQGVDNPLQHGHGSVISTTSSLDSRMSIGQVFTSMATYRGQLVALKTLPKAFAEITRNVRKEMKIMKELRHDNVNAFIGACANADDLILVTEYCKKGSLQDILENDDVLLDWMFIASLVMDLIKGMTFLHESDLHVHGNLTSSNCVVTSRWSLQVADFGLLELRRLSHTTEEQHARYKRQQWHAPEILRAQNGPFESQKADVYAFGIILFEIIGRRGPYGDTELSPHDIVDQVKHLSPGKCPFRPDTSELDTQDYMKDCMHDCWKELPESRPDFKAIRLRLKPLRQGMRANIFDNMVEMMEKYQSNLEELVADRTEQLMEEKRKTEALLHRMLPKSVADQLKIGEPVVPEAFHCVTIYFSDICGFTALSADSSPMQVVDLLNDLYTLFDSIIRGYDVYKVETIGDAYMVVSGLPIRNGDCHAGEIASLSLHLLSAIKTFQIRHKPDETLKLRVGIHSGPVVTGVVGMTMPRYCLFGDTVNTASRMESNGLPLKIHISESCKVLLEKLGGYVLEPRGVIPLKGKGEMQTYWLTSEDPSVRNQRKASITPNQESIKSNRRSFRSQSGKNFSFRMRSAREKAVFDGEDFRNLFCRTGSTNSSRHKMSGTNFDRRLSSSDLRLGSSDEHCDKTVSHKPERNVSFKDNENQRKHNDCSSSSGRGNSNSTRGYSMLPSIVVDSVGMDTPLRERCYVCNHDNIMCREENQGHHTYKGQPDNCTDEMSMLINTKL